MFMRILKLNVNPESINEFKNFYEETVEPKLQTRPGRIYITYLLENSATGREL